LEGHGHGLEEDLGAVETANRAHTVIIRVVVPAFVNTATWSGK
jgi:hypothetical protein